MEHAYVLIGNRYSNYPELSCTVFSTYKAAYDKMHEFYLSGLINANYLSEEDIEENSYIFDDSNCITSSKVLGEACIFNIYPQTELYKYQIIEMNIERDQALLVSYYCPYLTNSPKLEFSIYPELSKAINAMHKEINSDAYKYLGTVKGISKNLMLSKLTATLYKRDSNPLQLPDYYEEIKNWRIITLK